MSAFSYREVIELHSVGISLEKVGFLCGCGAAKASAVSKRAKALGLGWPVPIELTEEELAALVDLHDYTRRETPDYLTLESALGHKLRAQDAEDAYDVYVSMCGEKGPLSRRIFEERFRSWLKVRSATPKMLINWHPGEEVQVDWAARQLRLYGADDQVTPVFLFVATLPYSDLTFVRASLDMGMQTWLEHHRAMFDFLGGVPLFIAPDNLKCGSAHFMFNGAPSVMRSSRA